MNTMNTMRLSAAAALGVLLAGADQFRLATARKLIYDVGLTDTVAQLEAETGALYIQPRTGSSLSKVDQGRRRARNRIAAASRKRNRA